MRCTYRTRSQHRSASSAFTTIYDGRHVTGPQASASAQRRSPTASVSSSSDLQMVANLSHRKAHHQLVHNSSHHHVQGGVLGETSLDTTCRQASGTARPIAIGAHCPAVLNILKTNKWRVLVSLSDIVRLHASHPSVLATHTANWADGFYRPKPSVGCAG